MAISTGKHTLGPQSAELLVQTGREGGAAKAGHDLVIEVTSWSATLEVGEDPAQSSLALSADGGSLRVLEGRGGIQALDDDDKAEHRADDRRRGAARATAIEFRSTAVEPGSVERPAARPRASSS